MSPFALFSLCEGLRSRLCLPLYAAALLVVAGSAAGTGRGRLEGLLRMAQHGNTRAWQEEQELEGTALDAGKSWEELTALEGGV
jgi:hypothetical protein